MGIVPQKLDWQDEFSVHVKQLDEQHKRLITSINELVDSLNRHESMEIVHQIMDRIQQQESEHFETEEALFKKYNYPKADEHIRAHRHFIVRCQELHDKYTGDPVVYATNLIFLLEEWWLNHIKGMDHEYADFFNQQGVY